MSERSREWVLASRPSGMVSEDNFELREVAVPECAAGHVLARTRVLGFEPAMRGWIDDKPNYMPPVGIGEPMRGPAVLEVVESKLDGYAPGDLVSGFSGWREWVLGDAQLQKLPPGRSPELALSVLGSTGLTAYFGLLEVGEPKAGDTVVVSGAAGATGSVVGQIAKLHGCRVIGVAGGERKCRWLTEVANFDGAVDYKQGAIGEQLDALCPDGIDVFYDNVGGEVLDEALARIAMHARVVICGAISRYNSSELGPGPKNYYRVVAQRGRIQGFVVFDYVSRFAEATKQLADWVEAGEIAWEADVQHGFENVPATLLRLYRGANFGKQLLAL